MSSLSTEIRRQSDLILFTVNFLEEQIGLQLEKFDKARADGDEKQEKKLGASIRQLLLKLKEEEKEMDRFKKQFRKRIDYEKEKMLSGFVKKEQAFARRISKNYGGPSGGERLQGEIVEEKH